MSFSMLWVCSTRKKDRTGTGLKMSFRRKSCFFAIKTVSVHPSTTSASFLQRANPQIIAQDSASKYKHEHTRHTPALHFRHVEVLKENIKDMYEYSYAVCQDCQDYGEFSSHS